MGRTLIHISQPRPHPASGEFRQIFDSNPDEASVYAEKRLKGKYSSNSVHIFTNSFRMIYELNRYCHSHPVDQDMLISKLQMLQANFEKVPEIAGERIMPLIRYELEQLESLLDRSSLTPRLLNMYDKLVEYLHIEVMGSDAKSTHEHSIPQYHIPGAGQVNLSQKECPACGNVITESNRLHRSRLPHQRSRLSPLEGFVTTFFFTTLPLSTRRYRKLHVSAKPEGCACDSRTTEARSGAKKYDS